MPDPIEVIGTCPAPTQPDSMSIQDCLETIKDITRVIFQDPKGVDPFNDDGVGPWPLVGAPLADQAALKASFEDKTIWDALIADNSINKGTLTPEIQDAQKPKQLIEPIELPNGTRILPGTLADVVATYTMFGISAANHESLINMSGLRKKFLLIDSSGKVLYKNLTDAEIVAGENPWFTAKLINVSTRDVLTGAGNSDNVDLQIFNPFGDLVRFTLANTEEFGLII